MKENWNDQLFKDAVSTYQSIKVPSALRGNILERIEHMDAPYEVGTTECSPKRGEMASGQAAGTGSGPGKSRATGTLGKICKLGSLAACLVIMVLSLNLWSPEAGMTAIGIGDGQGGNDSAILKEQQNGNEIVDSRQGETNGQGSPAISNDEEMNSEGDGTETDKAGSECIPVDNLSDAEDQNTDGNPEGSGGTSFYSVAAVSGDSDESKKTETENPAVSSEKAARAVTVSISKLIPTMAANEDNLGDWEVTLVDSDTEGCTVELSSSEKHTAVTLSKNDESGQWEFEEEN